MTAQDYREAIKAAGKYIILVDSGAKNQEIQRVFDTPEEAHEYASARVRHTKTNKIDIYETTGNPCRIMGAWMQAGGTCRVRDDIKPYQQHHIGLNW